ENTDDPAGLSAIVEALAALYEPGRFPVNPRSRRVIPEARCRVSPAVQMIEPVGQLDMVALAGSSRVVLTDAGGPPTEAYLVGVGYWGRNLGRNFHQLGALAALCDAEPSVEETYRRQYENVRFVREFDAVLADPSIGAVALATPAVTHYELAKAALEAGKDVLVEKPLSIEVAQ